MRIALDTNAYSDLMRGEPQRAQLVRSAAWVYLPLFVVAELRAGFEAGTPRSNNAARLQQFLNRPRIEVLYPDDGTTHQYAHLFATLRRQGTPIPVNDLWIAALVLQHNLVLCTSDRHFRKVPQIPTC